MLLACAVEWYLDALMAGLVGEDGMPPPTQLAVVHEACAKVSAVQRKESSAWDHALSRLEALISQV